MERRSISDCYLYYNSSCTKGSACPFRHCDAALGSDIVCTLWRKGMCYRNNCKFRHAVTTRNTLPIPCCWENQPGGCRKPQCAFFHSKLKMGEFRRKSEHFPMIHASDSDTLPHCAKPETKRKEIRLYSSQAEYSMAKSEVVSKDSEGKAHQDDTRYRMGDLRHILNKKRKLSEEEKFAKEEFPALTMTVGKEKKKIKLAEVMCDVRVKSNNEDTAEFRVKSLHEIRTEKKMRQSGNVTLPSNETVKCLHEIRREKKMRQSGNVTLPSAETVVPSRDTEFEKLVVNFSGGRTEHVLGNVKLNVLKLNRENERDANFTVKTLSEIRKEKVKGQSCNASLTSTGAEISEDGHSNNPAVNFFPQRNDHPLESRVKSKCPKGRQLREPLTLCKLLEKERVYMKEKNNTLDQVSSEGATATSSVSSVGTHFEERSSELSSLDELETLFSGAEAHACQYMTDENTNTEPEDLFLELENILQS